MEKRQKYIEVTRVIESLLEGEDDHISMMATISCELKHAFETFSWVGFYRVVKAGLLKVGPYQGAHGCLEIPFNRGVCGKCATARETQIVEDVSVLPYHIACSGETKSEIVVPVSDANGMLIAVLDVDSTDPGNFDATDAEHLEVICSAFRR
jgi:L-methionine (R)-S-oxide reductase